MTPVARRPVLLLMLAGCALVVASAAARPIPRIIWNATASAPRGLYAVLPADRLTPWMLVVARAPEPLAGLFAERGYLPPGVPLLKRVAGLPGDHVCALDGHLVINGIAMARALSHDRIGRPMPRWEGCRTLSDGEVLLLMPEVRASLDGRYFGPVGREAILGRAVPLWLGAEPR